MGSDESFDSDEEEEKKKEDNFSHAQKEAKNVSDANSSGLQDEVLSCERRKESEKSEDTELSESPKELPKRVPRSSLSEVDTNIDMDQIKPSENPEQLQVTVHGARNLPRKGMLAQCNPFVVIILDEQKARSSSVRKSYNPKWEFRVNLDIEPDKSQELSIVVFDEDASGDDLIGETLVGIDDILMTLKVKDIKEAWLDMDYCNTGQIQISTEMVKRGQLGVVPNGEDTEKVEAIKRAKEQRKHKRKQSRNLNKKRRPEG